MNDADKHFGPKPAVAMPLAKRMTFRCEPRLIPLLDGLLEHKRKITGNDLFRPHNTREWMSGAKQTASCLDSYGVPESKWEAWLEYGLRKHNQNMLAGGKNPFVKSTRTLEYTIEGFVCKPDPDSPEGREKYRTDFWGNGEDDE